MNTNFTIKNPKANSVIGMYVDEPIGMDHPIFMVRFQSRIDAGLDYQNGTPIQDAIQSTVKRMRFLFGDDIPEELVRTTVSLVYAEKDALQPMQQYLRVLVNLVYVEGIEDYVKGINAATAEFSRIITGMERSKAELLKKEFLKAIKPKGKYPQINVEGPSVITKAACPANATKEELVAQVVGIVMRTGHRARVVWSESETIYAELTAKFDMQDPRIRPCVVWSESETIGVDPASWHANLDIKYPHIVVRGQKKCVLFYPDDMTKEELIAKAAEIAAMGGGPRVCVVWSSIKTIWSRPPK